MTALQGVLFVLMIAMALAWLAGLRRLSRLLRERRPAKYDEMRLEDLWPRKFWVTQFDNSVPVRHVLRFLWRRDYDQLGDREVATTGAYLRLLFIAYLVVFSSLAASIVRDGFRESHSRGTVGAPAPAQALRDKALALHRERKYAEAVAAYDQLLGEKGADPELVYWRGAARGNLGDREGAEADFRRAIELDPGHYDAHVQVDRMLSRQKRFDECVQLWNAYLKVVPRDANAYFERAGSHFHRGDKDASLADAKRACELGKAEACGWVTRQEAARPP